MRQGELTIKMNNAQDDITRLNSCYSHISETTLTHIADHDGEDRKQLPFENEKTLPSQEDTATLETVEWLGEIFWLKGEIESAKEMFERARNGFQEKMGPLHSSTLRNALLVGFTSCIVGPKEEAEKMLDCANRGKETIGNLQRAVLKNHWIRNQRILQSEHQHAWQIYLEIKGRLGVTLFWFETNSVSTNQKLKKCYPREAAEATE